MSDPNPQQASHNIAHYIPEIARTQPWKRAVVFPQGRDAKGRTAYTHLTFGGLEVLSNRYAHGLRAVGVERGMKTLLMVRPSLDFFALTFAIFKIGAVPILIDPGMGWSNFLKCVAQVEPTAFLGIPAAHVLRLVRPSAFHSVRIKVTLGRRWFWGGWTVDSLPAQSGAFPVEPVEPDDTAAILFTTGSTGPAKGVTYTHRIFNTQTEILRREYGIGPDDIDLPCFPLFALFSTALGATAVIPDMDPSRPAHVDPRRIIQPILDHGVTYSFGSPTLWENVSKFCLNAGVRFPSLKRVIMAGAPVPAYVHARLLNGVLPPEAETYTPYGATESLPVANFNGRQVLKETGERTRNGHGICVGAPLKEVTCAIIRIDDGVIENWSDVKTMPTGEIGEICVKGDVVTSEYHALPEATALAKIKDGDAVWHRMGDVGYLDRKGRLWFCGRKAHRVRTAHGPLYTIPCESFFNDHPDVYRAALVGIGENVEAQTPVIVVEPEKGAYPLSSEQEEVFRKELLGISAKQDQTKAIQTILFRRSFPVDIRHNAKIRREELAVWAQRKLST